MSVVGVEMLEQLLINSLVVFAITWLLTKSKILAEKREFVELRYQASKVNGRPSWIGRIIYANFTCPNCAGMWASIPVAIINPCCGYIFTILSAFSINWLLHCIENTLFFAGKVLEEIDSSIVASKNTEKE